MSTSVATGRSGRIHLDLVTLGIVSAIVLLGLVMVTSASMAIASRDGGEPFAFLERQLLLVAGGCFAAAIAFSVRTELLERWATPLLGVALLMLVLVAIPGVGHMVNGSRRWLRIAGISIQVSEVTRVIALVWVASYAVRREAELRSSLKGLLIPLGVIGLCMALLLLEPDFGASAVLLSVAFALLFIAGARWRDVIGLAVVCGAGMAALAYFEPYRLKRLTSFRDPWSDPFASGFQLTQSLMAIGRGGWTGVGLGESVQKLFYLPEAHTDFLFAVLAEELGLLGVLLTLCLFIGLAWRVLWVARQAHDAGLKFQAYLAAAFGIWVGLQSMINIGVNMGALPTKGLTLPFMSYGRSSMIAALVWLGIVMRVYHETAVAARGATATSLRGGSATRAVEEPRLAAGARA
ncbi:MAG: putative lipid II flippase FtsW [Gammaproteobacteria bacterium]|nr:putative lipid II flippase FtsW [Gammaproteobacteria bacterium]